MRNKKRNREDTQSRSWSDKYIYGKFAKEIQTYADSGETLSSGNRDLKYCMELWKKRLEQKNMSMRYEFVPRGHFAQGGGPSKGWKDEHYSSRMECRTCRTTRSFFRNGSKIYEKEQDTILYQIITDVQNQDIVVKDTYSCPSCGAVSPIEALQNGCPYCGTFFKMSDLFPKVTNFFFVEDFGGTEEELKHKISKYILPCAMLSIVMFLIYFLTHPEVNGSFIGSIISGILGGTALGALIGYLLWVIKTMSGLLKNAGKSLPMLANTAGSEKRFVTAMQKYSPEFSYTYFSDKVISALKMIIFSEDARKLPNYKGAPVSHLFSDIVDSSYAGALALKKFQVRDGNCYVTVDAYMQDYCEKKGRISVKDDVFRVSLKKNISVPINYYFSITRIQCKNCGSSFDATKQTACPNCGSIYEIGDDDWVVTNIAKR